MTEAERQHRAAEANRLEQEPILTDALAVMERVAVDDLLRLPPAAHEERWLASCQLKVIRGFRAALKTAILGGEDMARNRPAPP